MESARPGLQHVPEFQGGGVASLGPLERSAARPFTEPLSRNTIESLSIPLNAGTALSPNLRLQRWRSQAGGDRCRLPGRPRIPAWIPVCAYGRGSAWIPVCAYGRGSVWIPVCASCWAATNAPLGPQPSGCGPKCRWPQPGAGLWPKSVGDQESLRGRSVMATGQ